MRRLRVYRKGKAKMDTIYKLGVVITLLGLAGIAEAITGRGSILVSAAVFGIGFGMILKGYMK